LTRRKKQKAKTPYQGQQDRLGGVFKQKSDFFGGGFFLEGEGRRVESGAAGGGGVRRVAKTSQEVIGRRDADAPSKAAVRPDGRPCQGEIRPKPIAEFGLKIRRGIFLLLRREGCFVCAMFAVAVIDVGSNTLKLLVAKGNPFRVAEERIEEVRLSPGAGEALGEISPRALREGIAAVERLLKIARRHGVARVRMVATSMVREAANGREFAESLLKRTGCALEVLDGEAEARGIAAGVAGDPEFAGKEALRIVDLGGGSMEYVFRARGVVREVESFPLGAARLTRCLVAKPADALPRETIAAVEARTLEVLGGKLAPAGAQESPAAAFAGCGGVFTVSRLIFAVERGGDSPELPAA
jgi:hypothetical protein